MGLEWDLMQARTSDYVREAARHNTFLAAQRISVPAARRPRRQALWRRVLWRRRPAPVGCLA